MTKTVCSPSSDLDSIFRRSDFRLDRHSNINGARSGWSKLMLKLMLYRQLGESRLFPDVTCLPIKSLVDMFPSVPGGKSTTLSMMTLYRICSIIVLEEGIVPPYKPWMLPRN